MYAPSPNTRKIKIFANINTFAFNSFGRTVVSSAKALNSSETSAGVSEYKLYFLIKKFPAVLQSKEPATKPNVAAAIAMATAPSTPHSQQAVHTLPHSHAPPISGIDPVIKT